MAGGLIFCKGEARVLGRAFAWPRLPCPLLGASPPYLPLSRITGRNASRTNRRRAAGANFAPAARQLQAALLRLPGASRREGRRSVSNPNLPVVGHSGRLVTNGRKGRCRVPHPDRAVVSECGRSDFDGGNFFHGFLQHLGPNQSGHTKHSGVMLGC
jgi:hypothetical protein